MNYLRVGTQKKRKIASAIAQGLILGPNIRESSHNSLLRLDSEEPRLIGYANDFAERTIEEARDRIGTAYGFRHLN